MMIAGVKLLASFAALEFSRSLKSVNSRENQALLCTAHGNCVFCTDE